MVKSRIYFVPLQRVQGDAENPCSGHARKYELTNNPRKRRKSLKVNENKDGENVPRKHPLNS